MRVRETTTIRPLFSTPLEGDTLRFVLCVYLAHADCALD